MGIPVELKILNPLNIPNWDDLLLSTEGASFFHSAAWARVLSESYGYKPLYFTSIEGGKLSALVPLMEIKSFLTGRRGVSLPFTDYCSPIVGNRDQFHEVVEEIRKHGKEERWKYIEWRGAGDLFEQVAPSITYYRHILHLSSTEDVLLRSFRESTKRNIKKATKQGLKVHILRSPEAVKTFYGLNCLTRKDHGLPPQPYNFFRRVYEHIISKEKGFAVLGFYDENPVAGAVFFHFGKKAIYKYGASAKEYQHLRPNNLVMWEAIRHFGQAGFDTFDFGRCEPENSGLIQFKDGWGTIKKTVHYHKYDLRRESFIKSTPNVAAYFSLFKKMPAPLLNLTGSLLYRHVG